MTMQLQPTTTAPNGGCSSLLLLVVVIIINKRIIHQNDNKKVSPFGLVTGSHGGLSKALFSEMRLLRRIFQKRAKKSSQKKAKKRELALSTSDFWDFWGRCQDRARYLACVLLHLSLRARASEESEGRWGMPRRATSSPTVSRNEK